MRLRGIIRGGPSDLSVDWQTPSGGHVTVRGNQLEATRDMDVSLSHRGQADLRRDIEDWLLIESLEARASISVEWTSFSQLDERGAEVGIRAPELTVGFSPRIAVGDPGRTAATARVLAVRPAIAAALVQVRLAMEVWQGDAKDSIGRLYAAAESLVLDHCDGSSRADWGRLGAEIGFGRAEALHLYDSLQFGRHVRPDLAERRLAAAGMRRLQPGDCLDAVRRLADSVLEFRMNSPH